MLAIWQQGTARHCAERNWFIVNSHHSICDFV